jgi:hypothetical protein
MGWEYANVLFHEFGHALHMILSEARYPSLGPMAIEWDMVELPSQLNERWLYDRDLIARHLRHRQTGEPMPDALIDGIEAAFQFDRVFSVGLEYLLPAIVDMRLYLAADGGPVDPLAIERQVYEEAQPPAAIDPIFFLPHQYHSFTDVHRSLPRGPRRTLRSRRRPALARDHIDTGRGGSGRRGVPGVPRPRSRTRCAAAALPAGLTPPWSIEQGEPKDVRSDRRRHPDYRRCA